MNRIDSLNMSLLNLTGANLQTPKQSNICLGIGLWSAREGLSKGLPVDVMHMLLTAAVARAILEETPSQEGVSSKLIILIADSMAVREGAAKEEVKERVAHYKRCIEPLLDLLQLREHSEVACSSEIEREPEYQATLLTLGENLKGWEWDKAHYAYIRSQTALIHHLYKTRNVGIKVGWRMKKELAGWDERKFDAIYKAACPTSKLHYLYTKAGLRQRQHGKRISVAEGCPYTAIEGDARYVVQTERPIEIKEICWLRNCVSRQWAGVAETCEELRKLQLASEAILPKGCIQKSHRVATVYKMLNHWTNILHR